MNELLSRLPAINKAHPESLLGRGFDVLSSHLDYSICSRSDRRGICGLGFYLTREGSGERKGRDVRGEGRLDLCCSDLVY